MKNSRRFLIVIVIGFLVAAPAVAQEMIIYPAKGQSSQQLEKDKFECYSWAKQQTGFDPMEVPTATAPPPAKQEKGGEVVKGAATGAIVGGAIGGVIGGALSAIVGG